MATFSLAIRTKDKELNTVYIRISHNSKTDYIKTDQPDFLWDNNFYA
jgi:hypothetical protein